MRSRMIDFSSLSKASWTAARRSLAARSCSSEAPSGAGGRVLLEDRRLDGLGGVLALELVLDLGGVVERRAVGGADRLEDLRVDAGSSRRLSSPCRPSSASSRCSAQSFLISAWAMSSASRISASGISLAPASTIRMASSVPATIRSRSERVLRVVGEQVLLARVDDEVAVDLADPHRADGRRQRDVGDHQRRRGAVHREDVVGVDVVDRQRDRHELGVVAPVLGEQRADRAVDHARGQRAPSRPGGPRA